MRDIKFRAWDKTAKQMYQVDELGIGKYDWQQYAKGDKQPKTGKNKFYPSQVEIMQYTGLKDKNGVEIYEGDIVKNNWTSFDGKNLGKIWEVKFGEYDNSDLEYGSGGNIGFYAYSLKNGDEEGLNNLPCNINDGIEVIGNIYEDLKESGEQ